MAGRVLDREEELSALQAAWEGASSGASQLVVIWGRRRVGKTFLLTHVAAGKRAVYFAATEQAEAIELARLSEATRRDLGSSVADLLGGGFSSWEAALRAFAALASDEPLLVILDEVPYLTRSTPGFASIVQSVWDHLQSAHLMLVITGSAVGTMESILGPSGALRGRPTVARRLDPVGLRSTRAFLPRLDPEPLLAAYAACGGYPLHLLAWDQSATPVENLKQLAFTPGGLLLEDAAGILREELPDVGGYPRILAAIGRGRTRLSEIATDAAQRVERPVEILVRSGFVHRATPIGAPKRARPLYELDDPYLAFWFGVLYSDVQHIEGGQGNAVWRRRAPEWQRHLGRVFEDAARSHARRLVDDGRLPPELLVGRWWASSGAPCEVDVLGLEGSRTRLLGEARWQNAALGARDLHGLIAKLPRVPEAVDDPIFALWGRGGVDPDVRGPRVLGFDLEETVD